jgi:hypothetical protein
VGSYRISPQAGNPVSAYLKAGCGLLAVALLVITYRYGGIRYFEPLGIPTASRALNQFTVVVMTCIALIIPLTSNLYTPKLVKVYVTHPLILGGLSMLIVGHILLMSLHFFPAGHPFTHVATYGVSLIFLVALTGALPYLYSLSQFLRPSFFMPMLTAAGVRNVQDLGRRKAKPQRAVNLRETIDVVTNIALTGLNRGDRQLVLLALRSLDTLLTAIIGSWGQGSQDWRLGSPHFTPGLAQEGQDYLTREHLWPEAYVLAQLLKINEMASRHQHEILSELAAHLVDTAQLASIMGRDQVVELHVMTFNTLLREVIEDKDTRRFMSLSYNYRLLIEAFEHDPQRMHEAARHLMHYAHLSVRSGLHFGLETVIYDMGELILSLGRHNEKAAVEVLLAWAGPLWQEGIEPASPVKKAAWRSLIRAHWEARAAGLGDLADALLWRYLSDPTIHREQVELLLDENRELHFEFNDRLMRFAHFSPPAEELARAFTEEW